MDLMDMHNLKKYNDGYAWICLAVDVVSRMFYTVPVKSKSAEHVLEAMQVLFQDLNPTSVCTDRGTEWYNRLVRSFFRDRFINHYSTFSELKAALAERGIRTLKTRLWKFFTYNVTSRWREALPKITKNINESLNRMTGKAPIDMTDDDVKPDNRERKKPKFEVGQCVRLSITRKTFKKGYDRNFTEEQFIISEVRANERPVHYKIKSLDGKEPIEGIIYGHELVLSIDEPGGHFKIEKFLKKRLHNGTKQVLVKWLGYVNPSWIDEKDVVMLQ